MLKLYKAVLGFAMQFQLWQEQHGTSHTVSLGVMASCPVCTGFDDGEEIDGTN